MPVNNCKSKNSYKCLDKAWKYSCPKTNINYSAFSNGVNCLCAGSKKERTVFDQYVISGKKFPNQI